MERLKEILTKKYYIREMVLLIFIVLSLFFLSIYSSLAIFEKTVEKVGVVALEASEITLSLTSNEATFQINTDGNFGTITVPTGETKAFDITITNESPIDVKYKTWYKFSSGVTILDVEVGISNVSNNGITSTLSKNGASGSKKKVRVLVKNNSTQSATIDIGVHGGYASNDVVLTSDKLVMSTIEETVYLKDKILIDNNVIYDAPTFTTASKDRGLFVQQGDSTKSVDGNPTYYFRGSASNTNEGYNTEYVMNNYVKFGTYQTTDGDNIVGEPIIWRIVRINEDGSIKLISANQLGGTNWNPAAGITQYTYGTANTDSLIKSYVETWYSNNIGNNSELDDKVAIGSFCNDISGIDFSATDLYSAYSNAYQRLSSNPPSPTFVCSQEAIVANEKVGLITADEMVYGGALGDSNPNNNTSYLDSNEAFWTLTPSSGNSLYVYYSVLRPDSPYTDVSNSGAGNPAKVRAVINLLPDVVFGDGDGLSAESAYTIQ